MSEKFLHEHTLPNVDRGLASAGRTRDDFSIVGESIVCTATTEEGMAIAVAGTRGLLAFYGSTPAYKPVLDAHGWGDLQPELNTLSKQGRWDEMSGLIDDEVLDTLAIRGEPAAIAPKILQRFGEVADRVGFYLPYAVDPGAIAQVRAGFD